MTRLALSCLVFSLAACDGTSKSGAPPAEPAKNIEAPAPSEPAVAAAPPAPEYPGGDADEACAKIIVVAWQGAQDADPAITRDKAAAQARAGVLRDRLLAADFFSDLVAESDEPKTRAKIGRMGTYAKDKWPEKYAALKDVVFALGVGETGPVVEHPHGFVVVQRCPLIKVHTRHILVRYAGAKNADATTTRSKDDARKLATELRAEARKPGADFGALAKQHSEDSSAEHGGDLGWVGSGMFVTAFEAAAFSLKPPGMSGVVETEFGFHVIERLE
ncbi:foldase protein PrsA [Nannocystis radixulma]|uniref:peptidylprolyl isomerase n=1 Tax=Nannocystis radixulma TaxID=2995305 RepID=A0ABT5BCJ6_9BACT|nr:peptidylprolyl isomerase [Nannocystis radixulma]MDC0671859.1 peptidylprolyl isomerase [Nannocystis radixulma]